MKLNESLFWKDIKTTVRDINSGRGSSSGYDCALPMQVAWVPSMIGKLRAHMPWSMAKNKQAKNVNSGYLVGRGMVFSFLYLSAFFDLKIFCNKYNLIFKFEV